MNESLAKHGDYWQGGEDSDSPKNGIEDSHESSDGEVAEVRFDTPPEDFCQFEKISDKNVEQLSSNSSSYDGFGQF